MALTDQLVEWWCMTEAAGSVGNGGNAAFDLDLLRSDLVSAEPIPSEEGWWVEPTGGRVIYNGGGVGDIPLSDQPSFASVGDGMTVAFRTWLEAGRLQDAKEWPGPGGLPHPLFGMGGVYSIDPVQFNGFRIEPSDNASPTPLWIAIVVGEFLDYWFFDGSDVLHDGPNYPPFLLVVTLAKNNEAGDRPDPDHRTFVGGIKSSDSVGSKFGREVAAAHQQQSQWARFGLQPGLGSPFTSPREIENQADLDALLASSAHQEAESNGINPNATSSGPIAANDWVTVTLYLNGSQIGEFRYLGVSEIDVTRLAFGCMLPSVGGFGQAAYWDRVLTGDEITTLGDSLDFACPPATCPAGLGTENPLLDPDGTTGVHPQFIQPLDEPVGVIVSEGSHRHTRRVHETTGRIYELQFRDATGDELDRVREAMEATAGGSITTKWRHPVDDPAGSVCSAPDWLIHNADQITFTRNAGGRSVDFTLILEEVQR